MPPGPYIRRAKNPATLNRAREQRMGEHKNTILAVVLSLLVVIGWQYFYGYPQMERERQQAALRQQEQSQLQPGQTKPGQSPAATNRPGSEQPATTNGPT